MIALSNLLDKNFPFELTFDVFLQFQVTLENGSVELIPMILISFMHENLKINLLCIRVTFASSSWLVSKCITSIKNTAVSKKEIRFQVFYNMMIDKGKRSVSLLPIVQEVQTFLLKLFPFCRLLQLLSCLQNVKILFLNFTQLNLTFGFGLVLHTFAKWKIAKNNHCFSRSASKNYAHNC